MPLGQSYDLHARDLIAIMCRLVTEGTRAHADNPQGSSLTQSASGHVGAPVRGVRCAYHFFRKASQVLSFSNTDSAMSFFRRIFSVSSSFSRIT